MSSVNGIYGKLLSWGVEESRWFKLCQQFEPSKRNCLVFSRPILSINVF